MRRGNAEMVSIRSAALAAVALGSAWATCARAEGAEFGYVYGADTLEAGETELTLWATDRRGKSQGHYDAQDYKFEVERGITDSFQVSLYTNFASHHVRGLGPEFGDADRDFAFQGLQAAFKVKALDQAKHGLGLAFYIEPGWSRIHKVSGEKGTEYELELKAIVQKDLSERLVWAANLTLEPEWEREVELLGGVRDTSWEKELALEVSTGLSYRASDRWSLGLEGRYRSQYPDWTNGLHRENYAVSAGPTVHYSAGKLGITATYLPQLFGSPHRAGSDLQLHDQEKRELRLKVGYEF